MRKTMTAALAVAALVSAPAAQAHVTLQPREASAGGFARMSVRVPNERDDASTRQVRVQFPPGFYSVSYEPVAGWDVEVKMRDLAEPAEEFGEKVTEEVAEVSLTAEKGAEIDPGQFRDFGLSMRIPETPNKALTFKALQAYTGGEVVRWIGPPDSDEPAPQVQVTPAAEEGAAARSSGAGQDAAAPAAATTGGGGNDGPSTGLAIVALALGALGLLAGLGGLMTARRARGVAA
jgi:uncharacterized protein YcnI